ncbi:unnamed protein product, partial [marine sediment metagenome]
NVYRVLRSINPSPYMFYLSFGSLKLIGSSPEIMVRSEQGIVRIRPIAGTRKRGKDEQHDNSLIKDLLSDPKERAEHLMLVDLARNDLGRVCKMGTIKIDEFMVIEKYSHVMHIVSDCAGILEKGEDSFDVLRASFPAGTVSGAPKIGILPEKLAITSFDIPASFGLPGPGEITMYSGLSFLIVSISTLSFL